MVKKSFIQECVVEFTFVDVRLFNADAFVSHYSFALSKLFKFNVFILVMYHGVLGFWGFGVLGFAYFVLLIVGVRIF